LRDPYVARGKVIAARHDGPWICLGTIISDHDATSFKWYRLCFCWCRWEHNYCVL